MQVARFTPTEESELVNEVHINTAEIPDHVRDRLAAVTLECFKAFLAVPGNAEWLDSRTAARHAAKAAK